MLWNGWVSNDESEAEDVRHVWLDGLAKRLWEGVWDIFLIDMRALSASSWKVFDGLSCDLGIEKGVKESPRLKSNYGMKVKKGSAQHRAKVRNNTKIAGLRTKGLLANISVATKLAVISFLVFLSAEQQRCRKMWYGGAIRSCISTQIPTPSTHRSRRAVKRDLGTNSNKRT